MLVEVAGGAADVTRVVFDVVTAFVVVGAGAGAGAGAEAVPGTHWEYHSL